MTARLAALVANSRRESCRVMAKKSSTQEDPATLAFSAVEDALKDSVFGDSAAEPEVRVDRAEPQQPAFQAQPQPRPAGTRAAR